MSMDFVSRANRVPVDPNWVVKVFRQTGFVHDEPDAMHAQMSAIVQVLQEVDLDHDERSMEAASVSFRLEALTRLVLAVRKHDWEVPSPGRGNITPETLIQCACEQPLIVHKGRPAFDPASFGECLRRKFEGARGQPG
jgi:hypothetical protein